MKKSIPLLAEAILPVGGNPFAKSQICAIEAASQVLSRNETFCSPLLFNSLNKSIKIKKIATLVITFLFLTVSHHSKAQTKNERISFTYAEFRAGYGVSSFGKGLKEKYDAGNFSSSGGFLASLAAYRKFKNINYLNFGIKYKSLGAGPSKGDNNQEMFFNYWGAALSTKYFPFDKNARKGVYIQGDYFFITQFTQKYRSTANLEYNHQFAIGGGLSFGVGYDIPIGAKRTMLTIGLEYERDSRQGEVTGIGNKTFVSSNFGVMVGVKF